METEQMVARLLAETRTCQERIKEMMNEMKYEIKEGRNSNRKTDREERKAERKGVRGNPKEMMEVMMNVMLMEMREEIKSGQAEMRSMVNAWIADMKKDRKETMSCQVITATCVDCKKLNPVDMKSEVEYREVSTEEAAVKSSRTTKKRNRGRLLDVGRRGEPKN
jgi:hypothetical protein